MSLAPLMSSERMDWQTPENLLELVRKLGPIALDPATAGDNPTRASIWLSDRGLETDWQNAASIASGLIYVNPPYGRALKEWAPKIAVEGLLAWGGREVIALIPSRTDTNWFRAISDTADAICFWTGRLTFKGAEDPAPFPSAVAYWGPRAERFREVFGSHGWIP